MSQTSTLPGYGYDDLPALMALMTGDEKHDLAAESTLDVLWVLYDRVLRISPAQAKTEPRDRFYLSKGHGPMAFYAILAAKGFIDVSELRRYGRFDSMLGQHPDRNLVCGAEISSGSLGHGLPIAVGTALGLRAMGLGHDRVFVLTGDGELDEGSGHGRSLSPGGPGSRPCTASSWITHRPGTAGPAGSRPGSLPRAGRRRGSAGATMTRSRRR